MTVYNFLNQILLPILSLANICPTNLQANEFKTKQLKKLFMSQLISLSIALKKFLTIIYDSDGAQACSKQIIFLHLPHGTPVHFSTGILAELKKLNLACNITFQLCSYPSNWQISLDFFLI